MYFSQRSLIYATFVFKDYRQSESKYNLQQTRFRFQGTVQANQIASFWSDQELLLTNSKLWSAMKVWDSN